VEDFDQLGQEPDEQADQENPEGLADAKGKPGAASGIPLMEQWLDQVEGDPADLLRNQFMLEESRAMRNSRGMLVETRPW
jgi:Ca-activated chloride channel family protein